MVKSIRFFLPAVLVAVVLAVPLLAATPAYERSTEVTLDGSTIYVGDGTAALGFFAIMKDGSNEIQVFFGPKSFLEEQGIELKTGDSIKVVGSRVKSNGSDIILAREVTHDGKTVTLRSKDGKPQW
jgi:hypothetical protein